MYQVDKRDRVIELHDLPQSSPGAPIPIVLSNEGATVVSYFVGGCEWNDLPDDPVAIVKFHDCRAVMFGPPNDEAFSGHPLYARGLTPYSFFQIEHSSWIRILEAMNSVHPLHNPSLFKEDKHFVLSFHDSTFECIARGFHYKVMSNPGARLAEQMASML